MSDSQLEGDELVSMTWESGTGTDVCMIVSKIKFEVDSTRSGGVVGGRNSSSFDWVRNVEGDSDR